MSESLPVELNAGSVHAIDAPDAVTVRGPFHLELSNAGGAVHVHVHLADDLSEAARLKEGNHYVEGGGTVRVPIGTVADGDEVTGHLEVVTGYGAERERIEVTIAPDDGGRDDAGKTGGHDGSQRAGGTAGEDDSTARTVSTSARGTKRGHPMERSTTGMGVRGLANRSLPDVSVPAGGDARERLTFVGLAAVAAAVGVAVILTVGDPVLSFVVAVVVVAAVAAAGWLLLW
ncbi:DUF7524 family protein [Halobellus ruber]|uniref:Uncharacterized protein n=1 Tax=Halobellus ruber TaxID=2761102 RepID=A0A7J9SIZ0_9EURY|nr:hypothetical protein [Halobellus ruber]MBB6645957.1 hypothetical protein [Halobellus ruber]